MARGSRNERYLVMEGDWGGVVYLTCPLRMIRCDEETQRRVHTELERLSGDEPDGRDLFTDEGRPGTSYGHGGQLREDLWLNGWLADLLDVEDNVKNILTQGDPGRPVFQPSIDTMAAALTNHATPEIWERALLSIIVHAGFHGHRSKGEERRRWRADIWALRAGWEVEREADNLVIYANCASEATDIHPKLSDLINCVEAERETPTAGGSTRFVLFARGMDGFPTGIVEQAVSAGITLCGSSATRGLAVQVHQRMVSPDGLFDLLVPGILGG